MTDTAKTDEWEASKLNDSGKWVITENGHDIFIVRSTEEDHVKSIVVDHNARLVRSTGGQGKHMREPWPESTQGVALRAVDYAHARICVNALAGIDDPERWVEAVKKAQCMLTSVVSVIAAVSPEHRSDSLETLYGVAVACLDRMDSKAAIAACEGPKP